MDYSKPATKEGVELETLKNFLQNENVEFDDKLIDPKKSEPTDIRYKDVNYQITTGGKEAVEDRRRVTSKGLNYSTIRDVSNIVPLLLNSALTKKSLRFDKQTVLLVDVMSTGGLNWEDLKDQVSAWAKINLNLCNGWKEIYLIYSKQNVKIDF